MSEAAPPAFVEWILSLSGHPACLVSPARDALVVQSAALHDLPADAPWWDFELAVVGEPGRTALAVGLGPVPESLRLWLTVPLEGDAADGDLRLLLLLAALPEAAAPAQRLREALAEREIRHAINQPLTAVTFLLENLLFACRQDGVDAAYRERKRHQLEEQLDRLRALLQDAAVLPASSTI